jgi:ribonuclease HI
MKNVQMIRDGSCIRYPGPGGWACILRCGTEERELSESEARTTNNRMELAAAINGLGALRESCDVELVTGSQYLK